MVGSVSAFQQPLDSAFLRVEDRPELQGIGDKVCTYSADNSFYNL